MPVAEGNLAVSAATTNPGRAAFLLSAVHPIGKLIIGNDVIKLRTWLIVPAAPRLSAVDRDDRSLIAGREDDVGVVGIDPNGVVVVAAGTAFEYLERLAAVRGVQERDVGRVHDVLVLGVHLDFGKVAAATPNSADRYSMCFQLSPASSER